METYKWLLLRVQDTHGNTITYNYSRDTNSRNGACVGMSGYMDDDVWPTSITWGANIYTGAIDRYQVELVSWSRGNDTQYEQADNEVGPAPHETRYLDQINVYSKQSTSWERVRQYRFSYDYSLYSDYTVHNGSTYSEDPNYRKLTLLNIQRFDSDKSTKKSGVAQPREHRPTRQPSGG